MINNMEMELKHGQIILSILDNFRMVRKLDMEFSNLLMMPSIQANTSIIKSRVKVHMTGQMAGSTWVNGNTIKCMVQVSSLGPMEDFS
jgi:hypothetical protein